MIFLFVPSNTLVSMAMQRLAILDEEKRAADKRMKRNICVDTTTKTNITWRSGRYQEGVLGIIIVMVVVVAVVE